jgi:hypothetical protein
MTRAGISASVGRDEPIYRAEADPHGFSMNNPAQKLKAALGKGEVEFTAAKNKWNVELRAFGTPRNMMPVSPVIPSANANRVEYRHNGITEWYVNGPLGVEQGFTVNAAPEPSNKSPLTIALLLSGDLSASVDDGAHGITLKRGSAAILHGGLMAMDATGRELPSWMELEGNSLRLQV